MKRQHMMRVSLVLGLGVGLFSAPIAALAQVGGAGGAAGGSIAGSGGIGGSSVGSSVGSRNGVGGSSTGSGIGSTSRSNTTGTLGVNPSGATGASSPNGWSSSLMPPGSRGPGQTNPAIEPSTGMVGGVPRINSNNAASPASSMTPCPPGQPTCVPGSLPGSATGPQY